jgi:phosphatidylglycerophosphate synthase
MEFKPRGKILNSDSSTHIKKRLIEGPVSRHLNRRISRPIARCIKDVSWLTPNRVSVLSLFIAFLAASFYSFGSLLIAGEYLVLDFFVIVPSLAVGGTLVELSSIVDGVDGDLARERGMSSDEGAVFDAVLDRYADIVILTGLTYPLMSETNNTELFPGAPVNLVLNQDIVFITFVLAVIGCFMVSYSRARFEVANLFSSERYIYFGATRDVRLFIIFICSLLSYTFLAILLVALAGNLTVLLRLSSIVQSEEQDEAI